MLKTIIFDLGGVIVPLDFPRGYAVMAEHCPYPADQIRGRIAATGLVPLFECGQVSTGEFVERLSQALDLRVDPAQFRNLWSSIFHPHTLIPESLVEQLKQTHRVILLSNTNALHFEMILENYPILRHFDDLVLSYQVGAMKPDPAIYTAAVASAQCAPEECFFTDDIADYVQGARLAGIDAVQFVGYEPLVEELERRGVRARTGSAAGL